MLVTCFAYKKLLIKWFHWEIQCSGENLIFSMLKQSDNPLIKASVAYRASVIGSLFYLSKKILKLFTFLSWYIRDLFFDILINIVYYNVLSILLSARSKLTFTFPHIFLLYTVSQILSYHRISVSLPVISFLDFHDVFFLEDSNLSLALQTFASFLINMALLALAVHWTCINCNWKYRAIG